MWLSLLLVCATLWVIPQISASSIKRFQKPSFNIETKGLVTSHSITEASGICASRIHNDVLYTQNDSGDTHRIFAIRKLDDRLLDRIEFIQSYILQFKSIGSFNIASLLGEFDADVYDASRGNRLATITINGAHAFDWEDIACGPCPGGSGHCIYIADTGGNAGGDANIVYRIREPSSIHDMSVNLDSKLEFSWDQRDCESIMVDPNGEVYLVSKVHPGHHPKLVHLPRNAWDDNHHIFVNDGVYLQITSRSINPVSADISPNGKEVLIKAYGHVYYWSVPNRDYEQAMKSVYPSELPMHHEQQGEAVCWDPKGSGYYTLSEGANQHVYYYRRTGGFELIG